jgi:putative methyltransferase (TIGR04325 family)
VFVLWLLKDGMRDVMTAIARPLFPPAETLDGYEHSELVDVIFRKTVAFAPRDMWPEMAGAATVLDFGGACGLHYKQAQSSSVRWAVVETPAMAERARALASDKLRFFTSISDAAAWLGPIDVMH